MFGKEWESNQTPQTDTPTNAYGKERRAIMLKRWWMVVAMVMLTNLLMIPAVAAAESTQAFRQENGLITYVPPAWFLGGFFIAREKQPGYVFGSVQDFVSAIGGTTAWLIEDLELKRVEQAAADGQIFEYSLYLESVSPESTEYWVFVVLPYESAQAWFDARRAYHGRKAEGYYGDTQKELESAYNQGLKVKAELRFLIEKGMTSVEVPEDVIMNKYKFQPVFDLRAGRLLDPAATTQ